MKGVLVGGYLQQAQARRRQQRASVPLLSALCRNQNKGQGCGGLSAALWHESGSSVALFVY